MLSELKSLIYNMVKRALVRKPINDASNFQIMQVSYMGKTADIENILPYGLCSSPPVDSLSLVFTVNAQEENRAGITNSPNIRFKNLLEGEVAVGNYLTGSVVKFLADGNIEITSANDLVVTVAGDESVSISGGSTVDITGDSAITVGGNAEVTVTGTTTLTSTGNVSITAPLTTITGDLTVTGTLTTANGTISSGATSFTGTLGVTGATTLGATVTSNSKDISDTHTHVGSPTAPDGVQSNTGVPN